MRAHTRTDAGGTQKEEEEEIQRRSSACSQWLHCLVVYVETQGDEIYRTGALKQVPSYCLLTVYKHSTSVHCVFSITPLP